MSRPSYPSRVRILVVDNDPEILESVAEWLRKQGFEAHTACSVNEAVDKTRKERFHLVITEVDLPGRLSQESFIQKLEDDQSDTPVIILTAGVTISKRRGWTDQHRMVFDVVSKPYSQKTLLRCVRRALRQSAERLELRNGPPQDLPPQDPQPHDGIRVASRPLDEQPPDSWLLDCPPPQNQPADSRHVAARQLESRPSRQSDSRQERQLDAPGKGEQLAPQDQQLDARPEREPVARQELESRLMRESAAGQEQQPVGRLPRQPITGQEGQLDARQEWEPDSRDGRYAEARDALQMEARELEPGSLGSRQVNSRSVHSRPPSRQTEDSDFIHGDPLMGRLLEHSEKIAKTDFPVLLTGETGVGKAVMARYIHQRSARASEPFIVINCAEIRKSLPSEPYLHDRDGLVSEPLDDERERFMRKPCGHEHHTQTTVASGEDADLESLFETARGGTCFLDYVEEIAPSDQVRLLGILEMAEAQRARRQAAAGRVNGNGARFHGGARLICVASTDLRTAVREGRFRNDLYSRIQAILIEVPPLRNRPRDILPLAEYFIEYELIGLGPNGHKRLSKSAEELLLNYPWPGNVRELRNAIRQAVLLSTGELLTPDDLILG